LRDWPPKCTFIILHTYGAETITNSQGGEEYPTSNKQKAKWIGNILCMNCFLKHVTEGKTEGRIKVTGRQGRKCKQLLDNLQLKTGSWKLRGSTRSHSWKRLWTGHMTAYRTNGYRFT